MRSTVEASIADAERRLEKLAQADLLPPQAPMQPPPTVPPISDMEAKQNTREEGGGHKIKPAPAQNRSTEAEQSKANQSTNQSTKFKARR